MGFTLTVKEGQDAGKSQEFSQDAVSIGRTSDNDFVLLDQGVSRKHARIVEEDGRCFIEDLGSANGVILDGQKVQRAALKTGCTIGLGPAVLNFEEAAQEPVRRGGRGRPSSTGLARVDSSEAIASAGGSRRNGRTGRSESRSLATSTRGGDKPASRRRGSANELRASERASSYPEGGGEQGLSVAEKARILRENKGIAGQVKLFMAQKTPKQRNMIYGALVAFGVIIACGLVFAVLGGGGSDGGYVGRSDQSEQHFSLTAGLDNQAKNTFGFGNDLGVSVPTRYELHFDFEVSETIQAVYYLSFESKGIENSEDVSISLNSVPIGNVSGGLGDYVKTQKVKLPKKHLMKGNVNEILFNHERNTRSEGEVHWAISNVKLQMTPLPNCDATNGECAREAHKSFEAAEKLWAAKAMASSNAYNALKNLNDAMLFLEAVEPKPDFARPAQQMARDVEKYLDQVCSKTKLQAKRNEEMQNWTKVVQVLKDGLLWYPGADHPCHDQLKSMLAEYE